MQENYHYTKAEKERMNLLRDALSQAYKVPKSEKRTQFIKLCSFYMEEVKQKAALRRRRNEVLDGLPVVELKSRKENI